MKRFALIGAILSGRLKFSFVMCDHMLLPAAVHIRSFEIDDYRHSRELWERSESMGLNESDAETTAASFLKRNPGFSAVATTQDDEMVGAVLCGQDGGRGFLNHLALPRRIAGKVSEQALSNFVSPGLLFTNGTWRRGPVFGPPFGGLAYLRCGARGYLNAKRHR
jgi:hypothetical protein